MNSLGSVAACVLFICCCYQTNAMSLGPPQGVCSTFEVGHELTERSDATVSVSLRQLSLRGNAKDVTCFKYGKTYQLQIDIQSKDQSKEIKGIMVGHANFDDDKSFPEKFKLICGEGGQPTVIAHSTPLHVKQVLLHFQSHEDTLEHKKIYHQKNDMLFFNIAVVFDYYDYTTINKTFPLCPGPTKTSTSSSTETSTSSSSSETSTSSSTETSTSSSIQISTTTPTPSTTTTVTSTSMSTTTTVPLYATPSPTVICSKPAEQADVCDTKNSVDKLFDVRYENISNTAYKCVSISTLRFFNCANTCESTKTICNSENQDCTTIKKQYTCSPRIEPGIRKYECTPVDKNSEAKKLSGLRIRNLTIQKGCSCCETTTPDIEIQPATSSR